MRRALVVAAVLAAVAAPAFARARSKPKKRKGKVVRIERSRRSKADLLRVCTGPQVGGSAICWGLPPKPGELGMVIDETGEKGRVRVDSVTPIPDCAQNESSWTLNGKVESGDLSTVSTQGLVLFDFAERGAARIIQQNGQIVMPGPRVGETLMSAVDTDGDDQPEMIVTWYYCDLTGAQQPYGTLSTAYCMVYYERSTPGGPLEELRNDVVKYCY